MEVEDETSYGTSNTYALRKLRKVASVLGKRTTRSPGGNRESDRV